MKRDFSRCVARRDRGLMILEAVLGLALVAAIVGLLAVGQRQQALLGKTLEARRQEARVLEAAGMRWREGQALKHVHVVVDASAGGWARLSYGASQLWVAPRREANP